MNMRIMEILAHHSDDPEGNPGTDLMDRLAGAFTHDGLVKALTGFGPIGLPPRPRARPAPRQPEISAGLTTVPAVTGDDRFGSGWSSGLGSR
jgi:hypothetical protein